MNINCKCFSYVEISYCSCGGDIVDDLVKTFSSNKQILISYENNIYLRVLAYTGIAIIGILVSGAVIRGITSSDQMLEGAKKLKENTELALKNTEQVITTQEIVQGVIALLPETASFTIAVGNKITVACAKAFSTLQDEITEIKKELNECKQTLADLKIECINRFRDFTTLIVDLTNKIKK